MGTSAKALKIRIKSVQSTEHITRAMQLVASSKLRRCTEKMEKSRAYFKAMKKVFFDAADLVGSDFHSPYTEKRKEGKALVIVIGGDRGLAGGYNSNIFNTVKTAFHSDTTVVVPLGKRTFDHFEKKGYQMEGSLLPVESMTMKDCTEIAEMVVEAYKKGIYNEIHIAYTSFGNMLTQYPRIMQILPLKKEEKKDEKKSTGYMLLEPSGEAVFEAVIPEYISGMIYCSMTESALCEQAARRNAMDSATKNAEEMIESLSLKYNRARQGAITQEITEIVAGSEGLS